MTVDLHTDVPWVTFRDSFTPDLTKDCSHALTIDFSRMDKGGLDKIVAALYLHDNTQDRLGADESWMEILFQASKMAGQAGDRILLALEGGRLLDGEKHLHELTNLKVAYVTLTHNRNTSWADSATDNLMHNGLTMLGKRLVRAIEDLGVLIDVSHASDNTILDVLKQATQPVLATHSGVRALVDHPRNLSDFLIKEIAATGGIIGIPYASRFVRDKDGVALAIDHIAQLLGTTRHLAIGSDLDGAQCVIHDVTDWSMVVEPLLDLGYTTSDLADIKGNNFWRLLND